MLPGLVVLVVTLLQAPPAAQGAAPTAEQLIERVHERYSRCRTYREDASGRRRYSDGMTFHESDRWLFRFERPGRFRFEHGTSTTWEYRGEELLWRDGESWRTWSRGEREPREVLPEHAARCFRMFDPFIGWILPLLDGPDLHGEFEEKPWQEAHATGAVTGEPVDGVACWRVEFELADEHAQLWITDDGAIRRVVIDGTGNSRSRDELDLSPEFDVALDPNDLALRPPGRSGVKPSSVIHAICLLGLLTMGTIGILLGLRLHRDGRPFTVSASLFGWFATTFGGAEVFARVADHLDLMLTFRSESIVLLLVLACSVWPLVRHLRRRIGFHVVGVDHGTFLTAMRAVTEALHVAARISAAVPTVTIDGRSFEVAARPSWSMYGLLSTEKRSRALLDRMRPLVGACFESDALPANRAAGLRCIGWSAVMIVGGVALGVVLYGLLDLI